MSILDLKKLILKIDMNNINIKLIKSNVNYLIDIYKIIKNIWISIDNNFKNRIINKEDNNEYYIIQKIITNSILNKYEAFNIFIKDNKEIISYEYKNIKLYYFYNNYIDYQKDIINIIKMLKITFCIQELYCKNDEKERIIIWIPICKNRDFKYDEINNKNINESQNNFNAFTASGLTFGDDPRITIISRYEEKDKLLIHELIHNYGIDGSQYHDKLKNTIIEYEKIKNNKSNNSNKNYKNYSYEYSIYESYTELTSTYLMLLFNNIEMNIDVDKLKDKLISNIIIELIYSYNTIVNLAKLNKYNTWDEFIKSEIFRGNICVYEYYYIKGILYNNFKFILCKGYKNFIKLYNDIIKITLNTKNELLLIDVFKNSIKQYNFK